jgi:O-antigen ligase
MSAPVLLYLGTLTVMLFRPPDFEFCCLDRIAFGLLVVVIGLRSMLLREAWWPGAGIAWPMSGLLALVLSDLLTRPFEIQVWSVAAAKYFVPFTMFYLGGIVFRDTASRRRLEVFALVVLGYLIYLALASLAQLDMLIYPKFILDSELGLNAMRARGPFLQPVANGAALNVLGLIALNAYGRGRLQGTRALLLIGGLPLAILATLTRSVWLGFGISVVLLLRWTPDRRVRRVCWGFLAGGALAMIVMLASSAQDGAGDRLRDGGTVDFRVAAYEAGWMMFAERPVLGWGASRVQTELADRIEGFHGNTFVVHNTYFEILLEHGVLGFALYLWLLIGLVRLGMKSKAGNEMDGRSEAFLTGAGGQTLWLLLLAVYFVNATFVVMNYQFVNGVLFTIAGIVAYQMRAGRSCADRNGRASLAELRCRV